MGNWGRGAGISTRVAIAPSDTIFPTNGLSKLKVRSDYLTGLHFWNNQLTCISSSLSSTTEVLNLGHDASQGFVMNGPEHSMLRQGESSSEERPQRGCFLERPLQPLTALTCPAY